jgi:hypothetical protein
VQGEGGLALPGSVLEGLIRQRPLPATADAVDGMCTSNSPRCDGPWHALDDMCDLNPSQRATHQEQWLTGIWLLGWLLECSLLHMASAGLWPVLDYCTAGLQLDSIM